MSKIYRHAGISRQAFHQHQQRKEQTELFTNGLLLLSKGIREDHPSMGARTMYIKLQPDGIGRDGFERLLIDNGLGVKKVYNYLKTTRSNGVYRYSNLIAGMELNGVNQVWVSDISYYIADEVYYITMIMDLYSRHILGACASATMRAEEANIKALKMAFRTRGIDRYENLIHHSDGGGQYVDKEYLKLLEQRNVKVSMCDNVYDNPHIERVNGIIKNDYLKKRNINNLSELKHELKRTVWLYNNDRPHSSLYKSMDPVSFEQYLLTITAEQRPAMRIYLKSEKKAGTSQPHMPSFSGARSLSLPEGKYLKKQATNAQPASRLSFGIKVGRSHRSGCSPAEPDQLIVKE